MAFYPGTEEIIDGELYSNPKKRILPFTEKIVEKNKRFLDNYNKKIKFENTNISINQRDDQNDHLVEQNNNICKMFDSMYKNGFKKHNFEKFSIFLSTNDRRCKYSNSTENYINKRAMVERNLNNEKKSSAKVIKSKNLINDQEMNKENDKWIKCSIPNIKCLQKVENHKKCTNNGASIFTTSIATWNQLTSAYVLLFLYLYLILEIRDALDPIIYYV
uniref:Homeobox-containing protein n=1 Tax=Strongyloides papillosus TaxID=174720 RepID=A0A0N5BAT5_STREA